MKIPYINQKSSKYYSYKFPIHQNSTIKNNTCGIASTTMVLNYLTGKNIKLEDVATWADNNRHFNGAGSNATSWTVKIPSTTGSLTNTTSKWYGSSESVYANPLSGKSFTLP